ncbi:hypothetical protein HPP92_022020 [Vanilla planifolia]|uniref:Uncharacterized protein n=1 Tax=Vanilla planifolia TaxID=51239 RepID=A0A835Q374_VANPL|nr:hypothetical protein HPP92_022015 [Vanilla planifolia]KAG0461723.1 hypothetical protein HPP92_022020 [Vanilla planifolia]
MCAVLFCVAELKREHEGRGIRRRNFFGISPAPRGLSLFPPSGSLPFPERKGGALIEILCQGILEESAVNDGR